VIFLKRHIDQNEYLAYDRNGHEKRGKKKPAFLHLLENLSDLLKAKTKTWKCP
jgi:hypothetical protein